MRHFFLLLALLLLPLPVYGGLEFVGPTEPIVVGDDADYVIRGLTREIVTSGQAAVFYHPKHRVRVKPGINWNDQPEIAFRARIPGVYLVAVSATIDGKHEAAEIIITVVKDEDSPDPPIPPPGPGELQVIIVHETLKNTPEQSAVMVRLGAYLKAEGILWDQPDQNVLDARTEQPPARFRVYLETAKKHPLPVLIIGKLGKDGSSVVDVKPLTDFNTAVNLVNQYRGK